MDVKRFITKAKRNYFANDMYVFGMIQGLEIGICDPDSKTLGWDCELFQDYCMFVTDTTQERFDRFRSFVEVIYPGLCEFQQVEL